MIWAAHMGEHRARRRAAWVMLLAGCLMAGPAPAQDSGAAVSPELAAQKARMLEGFFSSARLREALEAKPDAVAPLESEARANLAAGQAALADGQVAEAMALFDAGVRAVSRAVALGSSEVQWDAQAASEAFVARRRQADAYLSALERDQSCPATDNGDVASLRARLGEADRQFANGELESASAMLDQVYGDIIDLVSNVRRGHTIVVNRVFETPEEEFEYERDRNRSYDLLVQIALAERGEDQPGLAALAARLVAESAELRDQAEQEGANGDYVTAIKTMERATERLLVVLRASGLIMIE
ncbi:MAG: hypothetical protein ACE5EU_09075 [Paracoccaceae bacterium]